MSVERMMQGYTLSEHGADTLAAMLDDEPGEGYPCSVDGKPCPCGFDSEDCR